MPSRPNRPSARRRGSILLLALFFLFLLSFMAFAVLKLLPVDQRASLRHVQETQATFVADAGIHAAIERVEWEFKQGLGAQNIFIGPTGQTPPVSASPLLSDSCKLYGTPYSFNATITPDTATLNNDPKRVFTISSTAYFGSKPMRTINATLANDSFARWVWFHDTRPSNLYLPVDQWEFDGPLHFNSPIRLQGVDSSFYSGTHVPFLSTVTSACRIEEYDAEYNNPVDSGLPGWASKGDGIKYNSSMGNTPYSTSTGAPDSTKYSRLFAGGLAALNTNEQPVDMPDNFNKIAAGAWGASSGFPTTNGVYANTKTAAPTELAGGLYIRGDVRTMQLLVNSNQNAQTKIRVTEGANTYEYSFVDVTDAAETVEAKTGGAVTTTHTVTPGQSYLKKQRVITGDPDGGGPAGSSSLQSDGTGGIPDPNNVTVSAFTNQSNGVIFSTGDVQKLWGENKLKKTICADLETKKQIHIVDDITRNDTPINGTTSFEGPLPATAAGKQAFKPTGSRDTLGLVAWKVRLEEASAMKVSSISNSALVSALGLVPPGANTAEGRNTSNPLYIYASMYAGHKRVTSNPLWNNYDEMGGLYDDATDVGGSAGTLHLYGGMQLAYKNATQFDLNLHYDPILARSPPPFYPSHDKLVVLTWREYPIAD